MEIKGKVHCFFEQSGVFKNEFIKLGILAEDYDIQNNFGQTDHVIDLFSEIESAYNGGGSLFDSITSDDLIIAFFPCIYFCDASQCAFRFSHTNYRKLTIKDKCDKILQRSKDREYFFGLAVKMIASAMERGLRLIMENPYNGEHFLKHNFVQQPTIIDTDRTLRGDYFKKPTAYWFFNCDRTYGETLKKAVNVKRIYDCKSSSSAGLCSEERSMISPDYARNFICDFIIGKEQIFTQRLLF